MLNPTETFNEYERIVNLKKETVDELNKKLTELTKAKLKYTNEYNQRLIKVDFNTVLNGRVTDATKKAYLDNKLSKELDDYKTLETECDTLKNTIKCYDDKLNMLSRLSEYAISLNFTNCVEFSNDYKRK